MSNQDAITVVKLGGAVLNDAETVAAIWKQVAALRREGPVVLVHGGGPQATALAERLGHAPRLVHGRRVTTDLDLDIALWTYRGALNARLTAAAVAADVPAVGLSGVDGRTVRVHRRPPRKVDGETVDFGWVGDLDGVDVALLRALLAAGFVPVVAPLGVDEEGAIYNVNADTIAVALAEALGATRLRFVAESGGVFRDLADGTTRLDLCDPARLAEGIAEGWILGGMRVKLETALAAARVVEHVAIVPPDGIADLSAGTRVVGAGESVGQ